jgi:polyferredoxin
MRTLRITLATVSFILLSLLFLDFTGTVRHYAGWLPRLQFVPALLALNAAVIAGLILVTLLLGRVYCSVICPLGILQDAIAWLFARKKKYAHTPARNSLRHGFLALFVILLLAGLMPLAALLEPYSAYSRIVSNLLGPVYQWGNNLLAYAAQRQASYAFFSVDVWLKSAGALGVAVVTLGIVGFLAWRHGRAYCNTVCPVGTALGFLSRYALLRPVIDLSKCTGCRRCERACKASCIDAKTHHIDASRCVACMNCTTACRQGALRFTRAQARSTQVPQAPQA